MIKSIWETLCIKDFEPMKKDIRRNNRDSLQTILVIGMAVFLFAFLIQLFFRELVGEPVIASYGHVVEMLVICVFCGLYYLTERRDESFEPVIYLYIFISIILFSAVIFDSIFIADNDAFLFMILLIFLPAMIMDKPWRVALFILAFSVFFGVHAVFAKEGTVLLTDIIHLTVCTVFALIHFVTVYFSRVSGYMNKTNVEQTAEHDKLTGIYNRWGGEGLIKNYVTNSLSGTLMIIDLDDFKHVNDTYGHAVGDDVLVAVARVLTSVFRESDVVMRMGGDEYVVYAVGMADRIFVEKRLAQLNERMRGIHPAGVSTDSVTVSIGAAINDGSYPDYEILFGAADKVLYEVKAHGKDSYKLLSVEYKG